MNKTVNINLGGMFFHIDEDAYQKLTRYFEAIKKSLSKSSGQDEIIKDIELRISELFIEKQKSEKHVISLKEVDEVIAIMGQPEDYIIEEDHSRNQNYTNYTIPRSSKKLYRDKENGTIGGVATGLGHYFGIDAVWVKIMFLLFIFFGFGTGVLAYIILWVIVPEATTTAEKLEMTGEPVTISNIEKKVREEFESVSEKVKNADYDKFGNQIKTGAEKLGNSFGDFVTAIFKIFAKLLGILLIVVGLIVMILLIIGIFTLGTSASIYFPWQNFIETGSFSSYPIWSFGLLMALVAGIPFFFMTLLGFKLLAPNVKSIGNIAKYTLLAVWLIAFSFGIAIGINHITASAVNGRVVHKETLNLAPTDTLFIKFKHNDFFAKDVDEREEVLFTEDSLHNNIIYSNEVGIRIKKSEEKYAYLQIEKEAKGKSLSEAKKRAEAIIYNYKISGNQLRLDNYFITDLKNKFRGQEIEITLYLPQGTLLKPDDSMANYDRTDGECFTWDPDLNNAIYKVENEEIICQNCPYKPNDDSEDEDDIETNSNKTNVTINKDGISIQSDSSVKTKKRFKGLKINKDGVIIKTE